MRMDSFELNKYAAAILAALIVITVIRLAADALFGAPFAPDPEGAAGAETAALAPPPPSLPLPELLAQADAARGAKVSRKCVSCHSFNEGGKNLIGPNLWGIVNRKVASHPGFAYSSAMKKHGGEWGYQELFAYLEKPRSYVRGTSMSFAGLRKEKSRADLLAYLRSLSDDPAPFPKPPQKP